MFHSYSSIFSYITYAKNFCLCYEEAGLLEGESVAQFLVGPMPRSVTFAIRPCVQSVYEPKRCLEAVKNGKFHYFASRQFKVDDLILVPNLAINSDLKQC